MDLIVPPVVQQTMTVLSDPTAAFTSSTKESFFTVVFGPSRSLLTAKDPPLLPLTLSK